GERRVPGLLLLPLALPRLQFLDSLENLIRVPELLVGAERQRYGCLEDQTDSGHYRFEALPSGFTAELPVDAEGLVIDYPGLFRRAWTG
ncbi:MAG TPA: putative glycolipid-binding domain-containing protein, partial [Dehalococcoidia bacterium]|nr:putative glycolipid-binding domain-containing protein [Dehalococcoidia bacterium]